MVEPFTRFIIRGIAKKDKVKIWQEGGDADTTLMASHLLVENTEEVNKYCSSQQENVFNLRMVFSVFFMLHRDIYHHIEPYVRRSALFTASCLLVSLHPTHVASALVARNIEIPRA